MICTLVKDIYCQRWIARVQRRLYEWIHGGEALLMLINAEIRLRVGKPDLDCLPPRTSTTVAQWQHVDARVFPNFFWSAVFWLNAVGTYIAGGALVPAGVDLALPNQLDNSNCLVGSCICWSYGSATHSTSLSVGLKHYRTVPKNPVGGVIIHAGMKNK